MSWVAVGVTAGSALLGAHQQGEAADARTSAAGRAMTEQEAAYEEAQNYLAPRAEQESAAMERVNQLMGLGGEDPDYSLFRESPGYQFRMDQGQQAIERSAAARGGLQSGGTLAALTEHAQGVADQTFQNYLGQVMQLQGQGVDMTQAQMAQQHGANVGNLLTGQGEARASGREQQANLLMGAGRSFADIWGARQGWGAGAAGGGSGGAAGGGSGAGSP